MQWKYLKVLSVAVSVIFSGLLGSLAGAETLARPSGDVLLKISGEITETNVDGEAWFDLEMLEALGVAEIKTETPWIDGMASFSGVLLADLMKAIGAKSTSFEATALDKYKYTFSGIDYEKYPIVVAWKLNDELLTVRTLGPLWIMLPYSDYKELDKEIYRNAAVWQLIQITVL